MHLRYPRIVIAMAASLGLNVLMFLAALNIAPEEHAKSIVERLNDVLFAPAFAIVSLWPNGGVSFHDLSGVSLTMTLSFAFYLGVFWLALSVWGSVRRAKSADRLL